MDVYLICMPLSVKFTRRHTDAAMTDKLLIQLGKKNALVSALLCIYALYIYFTEQGTVSECHQGQCLSFLDITKKINLY